MNKRSSIYDFKFLLFLAQPICLFFMAACGTMPPAKVLSDQEQVELDLSQGRQFAEALELHLKFKRDPEVIKYINRLANKLIEYNPNLNATPVTVVLIFNVDHKWQNYALPGNKIYLSYELLKKAKFENEVAALLALQLGHLLNRHVLKNQAKEEKVVTPNQYLKKNGLFDFTVQEYGEAIEGAADVLYKNEFDSRGIISIWRMYKKNLSYSPYSDQELDLLTEKTRDTLAMSSPLRNPIVTSEAFMKIKRKIEKL